MTIKAINMRMTERIWVSRVASEIVFQPVLRHWRAVARGACDDSVKEAEFTS